MNQMIGKLTENKMHCVSDSGNRRGQIGGSNFVCVGDCRNPRQSLVGEVKSKKSVSVVWRWQLHEGVDNKAGTFNNDLIVKNKQVWFKLEASIIHVVLVLPIFKLNHSVRIPSTGIISTGGPRYSRFC